MAPPVRERDDAEDAAIDAGDGSRSVCETPNKARRIDFVGTPLSAFAHRSNLIETPGGTSGSGSSVSPSQSMSCAQEDGDELKEDGDELPDPVKALKAYDETMEAMSQPVDREKDDMDAADKKRHVPSTLEASDEWNANFKMAVHEAGRRLFARCFTSGRSIQDAIKMCFSADEKQTQNILADFDVPSSFNISYKHVMGEALELMFCYLSRVDTRVDLHDYLAGEQSSGGDKDGERVFVECKVHKCFMSSAPSRSPFCMTGGDKEELVTAFGGNGDARKLAETLFSQSQHDRFFDVLIILKDLQAEDRYHIQAVQCKARTHFGAYIDIAKYLGHQYAIYEMAKKVDVLVRLDWVTNTFKCKQTEAGGDFAVFRENQTLQTLLYHDMCRLEDKIRLAAAMASHAFGSKDGEVVPPRPRKKPREFQTRALEQLRVAREDLGLRGGSVVAATGAGKSLIAFMDAMATLYDECGKSLTQSDQIALVWSCPQIFLLEQTAENFRAHEEREFADLAKTQPGYIIPKLFYYVVCSKSSNSDTLNSNVLRRLNAPQLFKTLLLHNSRGELSRCRFFTTIEGGSSFWNQLNKYIRVSRGVEEPLNNHEKPIVNVFIVDEAHRVKGNSAGRNQLTLNIPARWRVCYSATPFVEQHRASLIRKRIETSAETIDDDAAFEDVPQRTQKKRDEGKAPKELFPDEYFKKLTDLDISESEDPVIEAINRIGLSAFQLMNVNLQFVPLDEAKKLPDQDTQLIQELLKLKNTDSRAGPNVDELKGALEDRTRQIIIFDTEKDMHKGMCTCGGASGTCHTDYCPAKSFPSEKPVNIFKCYFDQKRGNFAAIQWSLGDSGGKKPNFKSDCVVLGWNKPSHVLSIRRGEPRGFACHDFTDFGVRNGTNLIGAPVFTYTFAEAFRSPDNIIAKPFVVTYRLKTPSEPMDDLRRERLKRIFGIGTKTGTRGPLQTFKELNKVAMQITFKVSCTGESIVATTQDYATVATIYRMIERREASKIMVFCSRNDNCRRCLALFQVFMRQRVDDAKYRGDEALVRHLNEVKSAHIYTSWETNGMTKHMKENVKMNLLYEFRMGKTQVLFNVDCLSTGIDIPCTDAVVLASAPTTNTCVLQRWGRALRSDASHKRGILALVMCDPKESNEVREERRKFMGIDLTSKGDFDGCQKGFQKCYSVAECAAHCSNRIIGDIKTVDDVPIKATTNVRTRKRRKRKRKRKQKQYEDKNSEQMLPKACGSPDSVDAEFECMLNDMFDIEVRDLLDPTESRVQNTVTPSIPL